MFKTIKKFKFSSLCVILAAIAVFSAVTPSCGKKSVASTSGNISNYGYILANGTEIYYTKVISDEYGNYYSNIYKYDTAAQTEMIVSSVEADSMVSMNAYLSLDGGYLYFLPNFIHKTEKGVSDNIYRVKPDGVNTSPEPLFEDPIQCSFMHISNGTIFYYDESEYAIYRMKTDGTKKQLICEAYAEGITVGAGKIYYAEFELLMEVSTNGGEPRELYDFTDHNLYVEYLILDGDYLYYLDDNQSELGRIRIDGTDHKTLYSYTYIEYFNINGGVLYFVVDEYGSDANYAVLSIVPGGRSAKVIVSDKEELGYISPISIWDNTVYFIGMNSYETIMDSDDVWYKVGVSGGAIEPFQPLNVYYG